MASNKKSFAERATAEPTDLHKNFAAWLKEETGVDVDVKTVQLACSMRMDFQRSEENQTDLQARKAAAASKAAAEKAAKKAKLQAQLAKIQAELGAEDLPAEPPAPAKRATGRTSAKKATASTNT